MADDAVEGVFLFGLEGKIIQLVLPALKVLKLGTSGIAWYLDAVVADRASVLVVFLDLAAGNLQAFAVVPRYTLVTGK